MKTETDLFKGYGVEVTLSNENSFLPVKETLTRIGIAKSRILTQTCHILHKQGRYAIMHFKELYLLDGKPANLVEQDIARRNAIVSLLQDWELVKLVSETPLSPTVPASQIFILSHKEKIRKGENGLPIWTLKSNYEIGRKRKNAA